MLSKKSTQGEAKTVCQLGEIIIDNKYLLICYENLFQPISLGSTDKLQRIIFFITCDSNYSRTPRQGLSKRQTLRREFIFSIIEHQYTDWVGCSRGTTLYFIQFLYFVREQQNTEVLPVIIYEISLEFNDMQFPVFLSKSCV